MDILFTIAVSFYNAPKKKKIRPEFFKMALLQMCCAILCETNNA